MCDLESVFEVRSGMDGAPGHGEREGGMYSSFELAKEYAEKVIATIYDNDLRWVSNSRAANNYYWVEINEYDVIYPEQG